MPKIIKGQKVTLGNISNQWVVNPRRNEKPKERNTRNSREINSNKK